MRYWDSGNVFVKTAMKDKSANKKIRKPDGHPVPSSGTRDFNETGPAVELSAARLPNINNITSNRGFVNPLEKRSFIEALADSDKLRVIHKGVLSGATDLSKRARTFQDLLVKHKNGWFDADFEKLIKIPEMANAEASYAQFMATNGKNTIVPEKVAEFYNSHPIAGDVIAKMREVNPQIFDGILPGSLAEFDMLKKILREEAGNKITIGASKSDALNRAENALTELINGEFPGFNDINIQYEKAKIAQDVFEGNLYHGLKSIGTEAANTVPFWQGISGPLTASGIVGAYFNPMYLALTAAGLGGKALMRNSQRAAARRLADGIVRTPVNINPVLANGLSAPVLNALLKYQNKQDY